MDAATLAFLHQPKTPQCGGVVPEPVSDGSKVLLDFPSIPYKPFFAVLPSVPSQIASM